MGKNRAVITPPTGDVSPKDTLDVLKARVILVIMGFLGLSILYALRVNLSVAIVAMVKPPPPPGPNNSTPLRSWLAVDPASGFVSNLAPRIGAEPETDTCPDESSNQGSSSNIQSSGDFEWNEEYQGFIQAGFFYGYAVGPLPGGMLAERFGGKLVFGLGTFLTSVLTILSPLAAVYFGGEAFFAVRFLEGLTQGVTFPAIQFMISKWAPPSERSRFSLVYTGAFFGTVVSMSASGLICDSPALGGWPSAFYFFGVVGLVWCAFWLFLVYDSPAQHPRIDPRERAYIEVSLNSVSAKEKFPVPWGPMLRTPGLWACCSMHVGIGWSFFTLITCLPSYLAYVLHFNIRKNALLSSIPYIAGGLFSVFFSWLFDFVVTRKYVTKFTFYRIANAITSLGPAATLLAVTFCGCDATAILVLLALNGMFMGAQYAGNTMNLLLIAPNFAGTTLGISNTFANVAGMFAPYAVGFLTNNSQTLTSWNIVFYLSAGISTGTFLVYMFLCQSEVQPWNNPSKAETEKTKQISGSSNLAYEP